MDVNEVSFHRYDESREYVLTGGAANRILDALADHFRLRREVESIRQSISPASIGPFRARLLDKSVIELANENKVNAYAWRREELDENLAYTHEATWLSSTDGEDQFAHPAFNIDELLRSSAVAPYGIHVDELESSNPVVALMPYITNHGDEVYLFHLVQRRFRAIIGDNVTVLEAHERWSYDDWDEIEISGGASQARIGAISSSSTETSAMNHWEETHSDNQENAESPDPDPVGYEKSPELKRRLRVPAGAIVEMEQMLDVLSGESAFWFNRPNPVQTYCPTTTQEPE